MWLRKSVGSFRSFGSKPPYRILCVNAPDPICAEEFRQRGFHVDEFTTPHDLTSLKQPHYDALLTDEKLSIDANFLQQINSDHQLKIIGIAHSNTANVDIMQATKKGIMIMNANTIVLEEATMKAEVAMSLLLNLVRKISIGIHDVKANECEGVFGRHEYMGMELKGKTIGMVGFGRMGKYVAKLARGMGMSVACYDPILTEEEAESFGVMKEAKLDSIYATCDVLSFQAPLTGRTKGMFNDKAIQQVKDGVFVISVMHPGVLDERAVLNSLDSGKVAGLAIDSPSSYEGDESYEKFFAHPSVLCTHDLGHLTDKSNTRICKEITKKMYDALAKKKCEGVVNAPYMALSSVLEMQPFLMLAEALGKLQAQRVDGRIRHIHFETLGGKDINITTPKAKALLQAAICKGVVEGINSKKSSQDLPRCEYVNSVILAQNMDISVRQGGILHDQSLSTLNNVIGIETESTKGVKQLILGSVFGEEPRIIQLDDFKDFPAFNPVGSLVLLNNEDRPGAIAEVLRVLADDKINVASLGLGRPPNDEKALCILTLDDQPSKKSIEKLQSLPDIENLKCVNMGGAYLM